MPHIQKLSRASKNFFSAFVVFSLLINPLLVLAEEEPTFDASDVANGTIQFFGDSSTVGAYRESHTTAQGINKLASTDNFSGAFSYSVPIEVSPGRNNLTPNINLNYNSSDKSNDGYVGYGWSFDIPSITRLNKTGSESIYTEDDFVSSASGELVNISGIDYGPHGKIAHRVNTNGVTTDYTYDINNMYRMSEIDTVDPSTNSIQDISYTYDSVGNITAVVDTSASQASKQASYSYDDLYRITNTTITNTGSGGNYTHTYSYNQIGNILTKTDNPGTYIYNGNTIAGSYANPHAMTSLGTTNYTYDNNGNLINDSSGVGYLWNYRNRLTHTNMISPSIVISYEYDQNDNRTKYQTPTDTTIYPNKLYNIKNGLDITKHIFIGDTPAITIEKAGTTENIFYNHQDHLDSTNLVTDSSGTIVQTLDYYPYGTQSRTLPYVEIR